MKQIKLTQDLFAIVDDVDYSILNQFKWQAGKHSKYSEIYAMRTDRTGIKQRTVRMHRQILKLKHGDKRQADHINHNTLDNRRNNLRVCTRAENAMNQKSSKNTSSKYKGVSRIRTSKNWRSQIWVNKTLKYLGSFSSEVEAAKAYNNEARRYHGKFACLNKVDVRTR